MKKAIFITLIAISAQTALADYHYASHEGSNEYPYTSWATAAHLIQDAVDATDPHDTLYIGSGDWYQYVATGVYDSVALIGMGTDSTFCYNVPDSVYVFVIDYGCSVENITFSNDTNGACIRARVFAGVLINNCRFAYSRTGIGASGYPTIITNCVFDNCARAISAYIWEGDFFISNNLIMYAYDGWAMYLQVYSAIVQNNIIISTPGVVVSAMLSGQIDGEVVIRNNVAVGGRGGIAVDAQWKYNNTVYNTGFVNQYGMLIDYNDSLFNNSITSCGEPLSVRDSCYFSYNNLWDNEHDPSFDLFINPVGNISVNPMYLSDTDFHLQAFSPLIDAGHPGYLDVDGSRSDIGAYGGPYGESYIYQDLPPAVPDSLSGEVVGDSIILNWRYNTEADFSSYLLHKDTLSGFEPTIFNLIAEPDTSYYEDTGILPGQNYYYRIASLDNQGNISDYSEELAVIQTGVWNGMGVEPPRITTIKSNYPNPFNSQTTIIYSVANLGPIPAQINVNIYDIVGRLVKRLVDERKEVGVYRITWDGRDDSGSECPSGVYFARIVQWDLGFLGRHQKLVLIR
ncbi:MAG: T9SS type A sorting domain-containing protein [Candidatus Zixiibacteriota bacterium]|nr:MAG: T9SS type A sorting domain-containing protein [candidate division Zixibacteria bacterium]